MSLHLQSLKLAEAQSPVVGGASGIGATDDLDMASSVQGGDAISMLAEVLSGNQLQIDRAMQRVTDGRYGFCEDCDRKIPRERLIAWPEATQYAAC